MTSYPTRHWPKTKRFRVTKTGRRYGRILWTIRTLAAKKKTFTIKDLLSTMTRLQAQANLTYLCKAGEVRRKQNGHGGPKARLTIYEAAKLFVPSVPLVLLLLSSAIDYQPSTIGHSLL